MQHVSKIDQLSIANGPGFRVALFVSGCSNACPGCFNPEAQDFNHGDPFDDSTIRRVIDLLDRPAVAGLTVLGGEPLEPENQPMVLALERAVRDRYGAAKTIWVYTGFTIEQLHDPTCRACTDDTDELLRLADVLVDGPFVASKRDATLRFRGSSNQRLLDLAGTSLDDGIVALWDDGDVRGSIG